jgi:peptide/nickel transport system permease protein
MIFQASGYLGLAPWLVAAPGLCVFLSVFSFQMFGDALREALDPRQRGGTGP